MSKNTGYDRDYSRNPYAGYKESGDIYFPVSNSDYSYHSKDLVMGVIKEDVQVAYPFPELQKSNSPFEDQIGNQKVMVHFDEEHQSGRITTPDGQEIPTVTLYWFAWSAFYPDGTVYKAD